MSSMIIELFTQVIYRIKSSIKTFSFVKYKVNLEPFDILCVHMKATLYRF